MLQLTGTTNKTSRSCHQKREKPKHKMWTIYKIKDPAVPYKIQTEIKKATEQQKDKKCHQITKELSH
jgi:hypothetical protein